ncbi:hypothetical protein LTR86_008820 [Recurvomyces mirabilis]|nr:hypothetical protein LTR86_008820 [Recurvomyces mirabilis]
MSQATVAPGPLEIDTTPDPFQDELTFGLNFCVMAITFCCGSLILAAVLIGCSYAEDVKGLRQKAPHESGAVKAEEEGYGTFQHTTSTRVGTAKDNPDSLELGNPPPPYTPDLLGRDVADVCHPPICRSQSSVDDVEGVM